MGTFLLGYVCGMSKPQNSSWLVGDLYAQLCSKGRFSARFHVVVNRLDAHIAIGVR
jgi:hypothetical protein